MLCGLDCCRLPVTHNEMLLPQLEEDVEGFDLRGFLQRAQYGHSVQMSPFLFMLTNKFVVCRRTRADRTEYFIFAYLKLAESGIERRFLSTVDSLSEELLMPVILHINSVEQSPSRETNRSLVS